MKGRAAHGGRYAGWRFLAGGLAALAATLIPAGVTSAATVSDSASVTVSLDSPGTVTLDGFDPARGRLTSVAVSLRADVVVQVCIENTATTPAAMGAGTATASLTAEFPGGANRTVGAVDAAVAAGNLAASNGTADCAGAFDAVTGRFPAAVTVGDAAYVERAGQAVTGTVLTSSEAMAPFIRAGTVTVTYTAQSDTELALPPAWDNTSVAQGQLRVSVTYTYTPASGGGGSQLPFTGSPSSLIATVAVITVLAGAAAVFVARRRRTQRTVPPASPV